MARRNLVPPNFINAIPKTGASQPSNSEIHCGHVLATLAPRSWVVVMKVPSGHRGAGSTGDTADFAIYQGGAGNTLKEIQEAETRWGDVDAYTPESSDPEHVLGKVANKLDGQARAVIVDLNGQTNEKARSAIVVRLVNELSGTDRIVILHYQNTNRIINPQHPFRGDPDNFV